jgi:SAM-dependent methyltransferase
MNPGTLLDVGCAAGFILKGLVDSGWEGQGIEPNSAMVDHARTKLGLQVQTGTIEDFQTDKRFDLVTMIQVIAHFYNLNLALRSASKICKPNGFWLIETVDKDSFVSRIMGKKWHMYSPPSAIHYFSRKSLNALAEQNSFREVASGRPAKWLLGRHAKSVLAYKLGISRRDRLSGRILDIIPDQMPIPYPNFDVFWVLYQKQAATPYD